MERIERELEIFFAEKKHSQPRLDLYRSLKPTLCKFGLYPIISDFNKQKGSYLRFQKILQQISSIPHGINLALAMMVEVNVAGGILQSGNSQKAEELAILLSRGDFIVATGVSEPGWSGSLKKLNSKIDENFMLSGTKSFITNGSFADMILWVVPTRDRFNVYAVERNSHKNFIEEQVIPTKFLSEVSHSKISLTKYPLTMADLVLDDYSPLGLELRLKEIFSLVSLLLGFVVRIYGLELPKEIELEWFKLEQWRDRIGNILTAKNFGETLETEFPFPIHNLLIVLSEFHALDSADKLPQINPDFGIFFWEDQLTKYLALKKERKQRANQ